MIPGFEKAPWKISWQGIYRRFRWFYRHDGILEMHDAQRDRNAVGEYVAGGRRSLEDLAKRSSSNGSLSELV